MFHPNRRRTLLLPLTLFMYGCTESITNESLHPRFEADSRFDLSNESEVLVHLSLGLDRSGEPRMFKLSDHEERVAPPKLRIDEADSPIAAAREIVRRFSTDLGVDPNLENLRTKHLAKLSPELWEIVFQRTVDGSTVFSSYFRDFILVRVKTTKEIVELQSLQMVMPKQLPSSPRLSIDMAVTASIDSLKKRLEPQGEVLLEPQTSWGDEFRNEPVLFLDGQNAIRAWRVFLKRADGKKIWEVFLNDSSQQIVFFKEAIQ